MRNGWQNLLAIIASVTVGSLANAQGIPQQMPAALPASAVQQATPKQTDAKVQQTQGCAGGGCSAAAPVAAAPIHSAPATPSLASRFLSPLTIGAGCGGNIGQACWAAERTFVFGSSKQFFNPGNKCGPRCGSTAGCGNGGCGSGGNWNNCSYFSYVDR
jgi:hypothetical protein